jgi:2-polyprenyl-3-methyl-5-hydroxy-6-metoxy-1,4-benzoquinol methylase
MCENNVEKNFITEKLWEPILTETLCFYWGCPNVTDWVDPRAFVLLDMDDFAGAFATVKRAIQEDWWSQRLPFMRAEKAKIMDNYTLMPRVEKILNDHIAKTIPSATTDPICFIHSCNIGNQTYAVLQKFIDRIAAANRPFAMVFINNTGTPLQCDRLTIPTNVPITIRESSRDTQLFEADTLRLVSSYCKHNSAAKVLYLHTKGISYDPASPIEKYSADWVDYMLFAALSDVSASFCLLDQYDTVGVNMVMAPHRHYSGNFWWSTAKHIADLPVYTLTDKMSAEWWLLQKEGGKHRNLYSSHINHFTTAYPENNYRSALHDILGTPPTKLSLRSIISTYSSITCDNGTDKDTTRSYGQLYESILSRYTDRPVKILEIGIFSGAFQRVLSEYLPLAEITGADITLRNVKYGAITPNAKLYELDCTIPDAVDLLAPRGPYDIIIDDASHLPDHQVRTFDLFAPLLREGGVYIIEDINQHHAEFVENTLRKLSEKYNLTMEWHDLRSLKGRFDDIVTVLYRGSISL